MNDGSVKNNPGYGMEKTMKSTGVLVIIFKN